MINNCVAKPEAKKPIQALGFPIFKQLVCAEPKVANWRYVRDRLRRQAAQAGYRI